MAGPTPQSDDPSSWFDDPAIENKDRLYRVAKTKFHVVLLEDNTYGVSDQLWTSMAGGCSTELRSLVDEAEQIPTDRMAANSGFGVASINVASARSCFARKDAEGKPANPLGVAYTPIQEGKPFGPNTFHCDIFPSLGKPGSRDLFSKHEVLHVDQEMARRFYEERHGLR